MSHAIGALAIAAAGAWLAAAILGLGATRRAGLVASASTSRRRAPASTWASTTSRCSPRWRC